MPLSVIVATGYNFSEGEKVTYPKLNLLGTPSVTFTGELSSAQLSDGSVTTGKLEQGININSKIDDHNLNLTKLEAGTQGQILYYNADGDLVKLAPGSDGQFLKTKGAGANPEWSAQDGTDTINISQIATDGANKYISTDGSGNIQWEVKDTGYFGGAAVMWEQQSTNTNAGATNSTLDQVRVLNQSTDPSSILADFDAATYSWDLDAGTYMIEAKAPAADTGNFICWVENTTDGTIAVNGTSASGGSSKNTETQWTFASGIVTIAGTKTFQLKFRSSSSTAIYGLGRPANISGHDEIYSVVKVFKLA